MSIPSNPSNLRSRRYLRAVSLFCVTASLLVMQPRVQTQPPDALKFFKNFFLTGDYVVAGVGLRGLGGMNGSPAGLATGTISLTSVPADADVVAAFLYWQVVSTDTLGPVSGSPRGVLQRFSPEHG
jgi:hypothetical protein